MSAATVANSSRSSQWSGESSRAHTSEKGSQMDDDARTRFWSVNDEEQYSLWLADYVIPDGWPAVGKLTTIKPSAWRMSTRCGPHVATQPALAMDGAAQC
jgi:hypothetical protein